MIWLVGRRISGGERYADLFRRHVIEMVNTLGNAALTTP